MAEVVTEESVKPLVKQADLAKALALQKFLKEKAKELQKLEDGIETALRSGGTVEAGKHKAAIEQYDGNRSVSWKTVVEELEEQGIVPSGFVQLQIEQAERPTKERLVIL